MLNAANSCWLTQVTVELVVWAVSLEHCTGTLGLGQTRPGLAGWHAYFSRYLVINMILHIGLIILVLFLIFYFFKISHHYLFYSIFF